MRGISGLTHTYKGGVASSLTSIHLLRYAFFKRKNCPVGFLSTLLFMLVACSDSKETHIHALTRDKRVGILRSVLFAVVSLRPYFHALSPFLRSFSRQVKGKDIFTRQQMANEFQEASKKVEVRCQVLENLANFKDLVALVTRRIHGITNFQGFHLFQEGDWIVVVVKLRMHHDDWLGFGSDGKEVGSGPGYKPWRLMRCTGVRLEEAPPYQLREVLEEVIHQVWMRQEALWTTLPGAFPAGE